MIIYQCPKCKCKHITTIAREYGVVVMKCNDCGYEGNSTHFIYKVEWKRWKQILLKHKSLVKTLSFRGFVLVMSIIAPMIVFKRIDVSLFTFLLAIFLTGCYYINEKFWEKIE